MSAEPLSHVVIQCANHLLSKSVPLVTRMCPSDTYRIYKSRSSVRIDTTLVGFDQSSNWQRGSRSYIFTGTGMSSYDDIYYI